MGGNYKIILEMFSENGAACGLCRFFISHVTQGFAMFSMITAQPDCNTLSRFRFYLKYFLNPIDIVAQPSYNKDAGLHNTIKFKTIRMEVFIMARINLSIDDDLFELLQDDADKHNCTVNVFLITILEKLYKQSPFDYQAALETLETEAKQQPVNKEFTLVDLPSFAEISVARAEDANLKPSIVRARLGKLFNARVRDGKVGNVMRSVNDEGELKFISRAAVYVRTQGTNVE